MKRQTHTGPVSRARAGGFTAIELMVSMTLSLVLMAGALSILYSSKLTSTQNEHMARIQEAGRTAFELIMGDARAAGFTGCSHTLVDTSVTPAASNFTYGLNDSASVLWSFDGPAYGYEATSAGVWTPALDPVIPATPAPAGGSDVLVLRTAPAGAAAFRTNADASGTADITVDKGPQQSLADGTPVILSDCMGATLIMATHFVQTTGTTATLSHAVAGPGVVGNASDSLPRLYQTGALIQPVQTVIYYVASCTAVSLPNCPAVTPPALWQIVGNLPPQELIEGVENMQVKYGVDTTGDLQADQYLTADNVGAANWGNVVSINLAILVRSIEEYGTTKDTRTYPLLGGAGAGGATLTPTPADRRQRVVFTTTIALRNIIS